jgi:hypothetical protein
LHLGYRSRGGRNRRADFGFRGLEKDLGHGLDTVGMHLTAGTGTGGKIGTLDRGGDGEREVEGTGGKGSAGRGAGGGG